MPSNNPRRYRAGFSLAEVVVAVALFLLISMAIYQGYTSVMEVVRLGRAKTLAAALANEQFEIIRNMPYVNVGLVGGIPQGTLVRNTTLVRDGITFYATTTIRNFDDPFDSSIGGTPNDSSPADYKLVAITLDCPACGRFTPIEFTTSVVPKGLETASTNGALFVRAIDASGEPISGARVQVENSLTIPTIAIDDVTDNNGMLQVIDAPTSSESYRITVSKSGYSTDRTYPPGESSNPNPDKPDATVVLQQVTQATFAIDRTSTFRISSVDTACQAVSSMPLTLTGAKLIGTSPSVLKFPARLYTTNEGGTLTVPGLEWDTYSLEMSSTSRFVAGLIPTFPLAVEPNTTTDVQIITVPKVPGAALFSVIDSASGLPLSDASVRLYLGSYDETKVTGKGSNRDTDWSAGTYTSSDGNIETNSPAGTLELKAIFGNYVADGSLVSATFDLGTSSDLYQLSWLPTSQPVTAGSNAVRFQLATNDDNTTWNFVGPDGTASTYYTTSGQSIASPAGGARYVRYKILLHTDDTDVTPTISDVSFTFSSPCVPPGQVYFDDLSGGTYNLSVHRTGYQGVNTTSIISGTGYISTSLPMTP